MENEELGYYRLAQGLIAGIKLHKDTTEEVAGYLKQYVNLKEEFLS